MKNYLLAVLLLLTILYRPFSEGFVVLGSKPNPAQAMTAVSLHPDQGKELEACAIKLTKDYVTKSDQHGRRSTKAGPINVIRRLWAGGYYPTAEEFDRPSTSAGTKALGSKKP